MLFLFVKVFYELIRKKEEKEGIFYVLYKFIEILILLFMKFIYYLKRFFMDY